jgi:hypothetical protein
MGKIVCPTHGDSIIALVCSHVCSSVISGKPVVECQKWECYVGDWPLPQWFCPQCLEALYAAGLPLSGFAWMSGDDDDLLERIFETVGSKGEPVCGKCFSNAIGAQVNQKPQV